MRKLIVIAILTVVFGFALTAFAQDQGKSLTGTVVDGSDKPVPHAIVYIKNLKTQVIKTFIAEQDGSYRFHALSPNIDYEVHAEFNGRKSDTKTLSSFDTRPKARINLRLE